MFIWITFNLLQESKLHEKKKISFSICLVFGTLSDEYVSVELIKKNEYIFLH